MPQPRIVVTGKIFGFTLIQTLTLDAPQQSVLAALLAGGSAT
jgi:hypothetical protein